ncbi:unnamed protein product, partial [Cuscuta epithymum]
MARAGLLGGCLPSTAAATTSLRKHQSPPKSLPLKGIFNQKSAVRIRCCLSPPSGYLLPRVGKLLTVAPYYLSDQVVKLFCGDNYGARYLAFAIDLADKHQRLYKKLKPTVDKFFQLDLSNDPSYIDDCIEILLGNEDCWICTHSMENPASKLAEAFGRSYDYKFDDICARKNSKNTVKCTKLSFILFFGEKAPCPNVKTRDDFKNLLLQLLGTQSYVVTMRAMCYSFTGDAEMVETALNH